MSETSPDLTVVVQQEVAELRRCLLQELDQGRAPAERRIAELEGRLGDAETRLAETRESLRLARTQPQLPAGEAAFRGAFLTDLDELRRRVRDLRGGDPATRAIDSALFVTGGKLSAETADRFIDFMVEKQAALSRVQVRRMGSPQGHTDILSVLDRRLRKGTEGEAPTPADALGTKRRTLTTVEVVWAEDVTLTFLEDNIEKRDAETQIARLLATAFGNDANDLAWNGDEAAEDDFLSINDGWLTLAAADADAHALDLTDEGLAIDADTTAGEVLALAMRNLPYRFKGRSDLAFFVPVAFAERYAEEVAGRLTGLGDQVLVGGFPQLRWFGLPVVPEPHLVGDSAGNLVLTPAGNLFFGVQRQLTVDGQWQPRKRVVEFTLTARTDMQYATGDALVVAGGLPAHLQ